MAIDYLFCQLYTLEFQKLRVFFDTTIERHTHLPRPRKHFWVFDRGLVEERVRAAGSVAFDHMQGIAVEISCPIEPALVVEPGHIDHQSVPLPTASGPTHPTVGGAGPRIVHRDVANSARVLIGDHDGL